MNANGCSRRVVSDIADAAGAADKAAKPHLGIVSSRDMWPHLKPHGDRDEFCPGMDYTGATLVAVANPKQIPYLRELLKFTLPTNYRYTPDESTSTLEFTPPSYRTLPPQSISLNSSICPGPQSTPTTRITPHGPSSATDPFTLLPPELLLQILTYLSLPHISSLRLSSRYLASFIHPTSELPESYFREAFRPDGEFEFLQGLLVSVPIPCFFGDSDWDLAIIPEEGKKVDWRGLYRQVQYLLGPNPELAAGKFERRSSLYGGGWLEQSFGGAVVPRSPGLANRRRIWGMAVKVAKEMRTVMGEWGARGAGEDGRRK